VTVYKPARSPFYAYDFQFKGVRYHGSTGLTNERDAKAFERAERKRAALPKTHEGGDEHVTVDRAFGLWWAGVGEGLASKATVEYQALALVEGLGPDRPLSSLTLKDFDAYRAARRQPRIIPAKTRTVRGKAVEVQPATEKRLSESSINREIELARRVIRWLGTEGRGYAVPRIEWKNALRREPQERIRELSKDEEERLFAVLDADLARLAEFAMLSGQRRTELINLRWQDVDLEGRRARVTIKGGGKHTFPLSPRMVRLLVSCPRVKGVEHVFTFECEDDMPKGMAPNVVRLKGARYPFSKQGWTRKWRRALAATGIEDFRFHDLRHTAATRMVRATGNLKTAQRLLGHTEISTTSRYAHVTDDDLLEAMNRAHGDSDSRNSPGQSPAAPELTAEAADKVQWN